MNVVLHIAASGLYLLAAGLGYAALRAGGVSRPVPWLLAAGGIAHAGAFAAMHGEAHVLPLTSFPMALSLIGWLVAVSFLLSLGVARVREVGAWVGLFAGAFTAVAAAALIAGSRAQAPAESTAWSHAHVLLSTFGFSLLGLASVAGLGYLAKERALKRKHPARFGLPSLESLDRFEHFTLTAGFPLLTLGVITGFAWGASHGLSPWTGHTLWLLAAWAVYLLPITLRVIRRQHGERPARTVVIGFAVLAFSYLGVRLLGGAA